MNSRAKGARGEREFAEYLRAHGFQARRGQQFAGGQDNPDVISDIPGVHWEVKRVEAGNPYSWLDQAIGDSGNKLPVVAHKRNRRDWIGVLRMDDLVGLLRAHAINEGVRTAASDPSNLALEPQELSDSPATLYVDA